MEYISICQISHLLQQRPHIIQILCIGPEIFINHHRTHTRAQIRSQAIIDLPGIYPVVIQLHPQPSQPRIPPPSDASGKRRKKFQLHKGRDTWRIAKGGEEGGIK